MSSVSRVAYESYFFRGNKKEDAMHLATQVS